jgi:hypothetical protein
MNRSVFSIIVKSPHLEMATTLCIDGCMRGLEFFSLPRDDGGLYLSYAKGLRSLRLLLLRLQKRNVINENRALAAEHLFFFFLVFLAQIYCNYVLCPDSESQKEENIMGGGSCYILDNISHLHLAL